jgi:multimeric flavodoxin WrbA
MTPHDQEHPVTELSEQDQRLCDEAPASYDDLRALFVNCTLKPSPEPSHTQALADRSIAIMRANGVSVDTVRAVDHQLAPGVYPDMTEHGADRDDWPGIFEQVMAADILVLLTPIWLGEKSSVATRVVERLYGNSGLLNDAGQYAYYGRTGGVIVTGNEDGAKHCAMNLLYSLQHLGYVIPPQADAAWLGEAGPGPSYADEGSGGPSQRLHQPQHHLHDLEPAPHRPLAQGRRRLPRPRQPTRAVGRRLPIRRSEPRTPVSGSVHEQLVTGRPG